MSARLILFVFLFLLLAAARAESSLTCDREVSDSQAALQTAFMERPSR
jgi:hypothetical protein